MPRKGADLRAAATLRPQDVAWHTAAHPDQPKPLRVTDSRPGCSGVNAAGRAVRRRVRFR